MIAGDNLLYARFPLFSPLQGKFATYSGFLAKLDGSASNLLFSTLCGRFPQGFVAERAGPGFEHCQAIIAGSTILNDYQFAVPIFLDAYVSEYDMSDIPNVRLDSVKNAASLAKAGRSRLARS